MSGLRSINPIDPLLLGTYLGTEWRTLSDVAARFAATDIFEGRWTQAEREYATSILLAKWREKDGTFFFLTAACADGGEAYKPAMFADLTDLRRARHWLGLRATQVIERLAAAGRPDLAEQHRAAIHASLRAAREQLRDAA